MSSNNSTEYEASPGASGQETQGQNQNRYEIYRGNLIQPTQERADIHDSTISSPINYLSDSTDDYEINEIPNNKNTTPAINNCRIETPETLTIDPVRTQEMQQIMNRVLEERHNRTTDPNWRKRSKKWCFTWNNYPNDWSSKLAQLIAIKELQIKFLIAEQETGEEGTPHIQGYLRSNARIYYRTLRSKIDCYWTEAKGSEEQNINYCTKENNNVFKWGTPVTKSAINRLTRDEKIRNMRKDVLEITWDQFEEKYPYESTFQQQTWLKYKYEHKQDDGIWSGELRDKNIWIYGPPGTGKSSWAWKQSDKIYVKLQNKWWDGFHFKEYDLVLIEDFANDKQMLAPYIKQWADRYKFVAEIKNGVIWINPKQFRMIITSNYSIEQCFGPEDAAAIKRRFREICINDRNDIRLGMRMEQIQ